MRNVYIATLVGLALLATSCSGIGGGSWNQELADEFNVEAKQCVEDRGFEYPASGYYDTPDLLSDNPNVLAFDECWAELSASPKYLELGLQPPTEFLASTRSEQFSWWKCIEENGYERVTVIPLNAEGGWPLSPSAANFNVSNDQDAMATFYELAAKCGDTQVDQFIDEDGSYWYGEGVGECQIHEHDGEPEHGHDCATTDSYPGEG